MAAIEVKRIHLITPQHIPLLLVTPKRDNPYSGESPSSKGPGHTKKSDCLHYINPLIPKKKRERKTRRCLSISEKIGAINANYLNKPSPKLRKENKIKTIHSSLKIEGNTLSEEQVTVLLENKRRIGPKKDVREVLNAIEIYEHLENYNPFKEKSFLQCHRDLMNNLLVDAGKYLSQGADIMKGSNVENFTPPHQNFQFLMKDLFNYLKKSEEIELIKGYVFHYEMEECEDYGKR